MPFSLRFFRLRIRPLAAIFDIFCRYFQAIAATLFSADTSYAFDISAATYFRFDTAIAIEMMPLLMPPPFSFSLIADISAG
jgi:hypothetical protein